MRKGKRVYYIVAVFFFFSFFLAGGALEEREMKTFRNVFILDWKENTIKLLLNGQEKRYICDEYARREKKEVLADVIMRGKRVLKVHQGEREDQVVEVFGGKKGKKKEQSKMQSRNVLANNKKEEEKIWMAVKKKWSRERLYGYPF